MDPDDLSTSPCAPHAHPLSWWNDVLYKVSFSLIFNFLKKWFCQLFWELCVCLLIDGRAKAAIGDVQSATAAHKRKVWLVEIVVLLLASVFEYVYFRCTPVLPPICAIMALVVSMPGLKLRQYAARLCKLWTQSTTRARHWGDGGDETDEYDSSLVTMNASGGIVIPWIPAGLLLPLACGVEYLFFYSLPVFLPLAVIFSLAVCELWRNYTAHHLASSTMNAYGGVLIPWIPAGLLLLLASGVECLYFHSLPVFLPLAVIFSLAVCELWHKYTAHHLASSTMNAYGGVVVPWMLLACGVEYFYFHSFPVALPLTVIFSLAVCELWLKWRNYTAHHLASSTKKARSYNWGESDDEMDRYDWRSVTMPANGVSTPGSHQPVNRSLWNNVNQSDSPVVHNTSTPSPRAAPARRSPRSRKPPITPVVSHRTVPSSVTVGSVVSSLSALPLSISSLMSQSHSSNTSLDDSGGHSPVDFKSPSLSTDKLWNLSPRDCVSSLLNANKQWTHSYSLRSAVKPPGLPNSGGNLCFFNSVIQCLAHCPCLVDELSKACRALDFSHLPLPEGRLVQPLSALLQECQQRNRNDCRIVPTATFRNVVGALKPSLVRPLNSSLRQEQNDAGEFLMWLLDSLHRALNQAQRHRQPLVEKDTLLSPYVERALARLPLENRSNLEMLSTTSLANLGELCRLTMAESIADESFFAGVIQLLAETNDILHHRTNGSIIESLFASQLVTARRCLRCDRVTASFQPMRMFNLYLPQTRHVHTPLSLRDCVAQFSRLEHMDGQNQLICECGQSLWSGEQKPSDGESRTLVRCLPPLLVLQLVRYEFVTGRISKVSSAVDIPLQGLNLNGILFEQNVNLACNTNQACLYDLCGLILHAGGSPFCGHYVAYCKQSNNTWYQFNDDTVTEVHNMQKECTGDGVRRSSYILFYARRY